MNVRLYMDVHVRRAVTTGLRLRGVDVLTAQEDDCSTLDDPDLLDRATFLNRVLFSQDRDLLVEASRRQREGRAFSGVVYAHHLKVTIGRCIHDLELIAKTESSEWSDRLVYLPLT